ncbi:MAG: heparinase II/III family protein [Ignavibacteria bacterium]|jgi:hypothetical protein
MRMLVFVLLSIVSLQAQTRPFGIITQSECEQLRLNHSYSPLIAGIHASAQQGIPAGNQSTTDRRVRATIAKNAAFIAYLNRKVKNDTLAQLPILEREQLINAALTILQQCQTTIPQLSITTPNAYEDWQWHSKEFIDLLSAYDLLRGLPEISQSTMDTIERRLAMFAITFHREATKSIFGLTFFGTVRNNHALMTAGAIGMAGIILRDYKSLIPEDQPIFWLNTALNAIDDIMFTGSQAQSNRDGNAGYAEGPHYYRYAMLNMLPMFRAMHHVYPDTLFTLNKRTIRHPFHDPRFKNCSRWLTSILQPDGTYPALGDSFLGMGFPELALTGDSTLVYPFTDNELGSQLNSTVDMRANYCAAQILPALKFEQGLNVNSEAGAVTMRSPKWYAHAIAKNGNARTAGAGHSQSDMTSFLLWTHGLPIILDPGYLQYSMRDLVGNAQQHNVILVNGQGPPNGAPLQPGGADAFVEESFSIPGIDYARITTSYSGAIITRHLFNVTDSVFVNIDKCISQTPQKFTHQVHGNGLINGNEETGLAYWQNSGPSTTMTWERDSARADALWSAVPLETFVADTSVHEEAYRKTGTHSVLRTHAMQSSSALFAGMIIPRARQSMTSIVPTLVTKDTMTLGIACDYESASGAMFIVKSDTAFREVEGWSRREIGFQAKTDAECSGLWKGPGEEDFALCMINGSRFINVETNTELIATSKKTTVALSATDTSFIIYAGDACTINHDLLALIPFAESEGYVIQNVTGNISDWNQHSFTMKNRGYANVKYGKPLSIKEERIISLFHVKHGEDIMIPLQEMGHEARVNILDITGKLVNSIVYQEGENMAKIPCNHLMTGTYLIIVTDGIKSMHLMVHISG